MTEQPILGDRRGEEAPGAFNIDIDSELLRVISGGGGYHDILFFTEEPVKELNECFNRVFAGTDQEHSRRQVKVIAEQSEELAGWDCPECGTFFAVETGAGVVCPVCGHDDLDEAEVNNNE
jgi:DNA-directed RNA polymerase subunit RPC12/RpoP